MIEAGEGLYSVVGVVVLVYRRPNYRENAAVWSSGWNSSQAQIFLKKLLVKFLTLSFFTSFFN